MVENDFMYFCGAAYFLFSPCFSHYRKLCCGGCEQHYSGWLFLSEGKQLLTLNMGGKEKKNQFKLLILRQDGISVLCITGLFVKSRVASTKLRQTRVETQHKSAATDAPFVQQTVHLTFYRRLLRSQFVLLCCFTGCFTHS